MARILNFFDYDFCNDIGQSQVLDKMITIRMHLEQAAGVASKLGPMGERLSWMINDTLELIDEDLSDRSGEHEIAKAELI